MKTLPLEIMSYAENMVTTLKAQMLIFTLIFSHIHSLDGISLQRLHKKHDSAAVYMLSKSLHKTVKHN